MKKLLIAIMMTFAMFVLAACGEVETIYVEVPIEAEILPLAINVGETFSAEVDAIISSAGLWDHMGGHTFGVSNLDDGWHLNIQWRGAGNFFGNPPESWEDATEQERNEYFIDYLISVGGLSPDHEIDEFVVTLYWPADGAHGASYTEITGKMVEFQIPAADMHRINAVIGFYSLHMQFDDEGAFFIHFTNTAEDEDRFNENQAIFENFLGSIQLMRFYR
ncbi:MAG: hypothetical protein FWC76_06825 [Defluviitaleaceae bacterium]|nr:hypothetical protein [Defluviitaleaceae bacterium]